MDSMESRFERALHQSSRAWSLALGRRLKSHGLSEAAWLTIAMLGGTGVPLSQARLAQLLGLEGATVAAMVSRLATAGLLLRHASAGDRRIRLVALTADGELLYQQVKIEADAVRCDFLSTFDAEVLLTGTVLLENVQRDARRAGE